MSFIRKWLGIKKPETIIMAQAKKEAAKPIRMGGQTQLAKRTAGYQKEYWEDEMKNRTKLTGLGGGGNMFS